MGSILEMYGKPAIEQIPEPVQVATEEVPAAPAAEPEVATTAEVATKVEAPETSSLKTEEVDFYTLTKGKIKSLEDIDAIETRAKDYETKLTKLESERYANEFIARLDELARSGKTIDANLLSEINIDYNSYDVTNPDHALALVAKKIKQEDPSITDRELAFEVEDRFGKLNKPDEFASDEEKAAYERAVMKITREAKKIKPELESFQKSLTAPLQKQNELTQSQIAEQQKQLELWNNTVKQEVSKFDKLSVKIEDEEFAYEIPMEGRAAVESSIVNSDKFFNKFIKPDNTVDFNRLSKAMYFSEEGNLEKFINAAVSQALAKGSKKTIENLNNTNMKPTQAPTTTSPAISEDLRRQVNQYRNNMTFNSPPTK